MSASIEKEIQSREGKLFLQQWFKNPKQLGTLAPISVSLAEAAASLIEDTDGLVVEIGSGTGRLTRALLRGGVKPSNLALVEIDAPMCEFLCETLKEVIPSLPYIIHGDAANLQNILPKNFCGKTNTIVSAIPFMYMPTKLRDDIINSCFDIMPEGGKIIQVSYNPWSPFAHRDDISQERVRSLWLNLPPGFVWVFRKSQGKTPSL